MTNTTNVVDISRSLSSKNIQPKLEWSIQCILDLTACCYAESVKFKCFVSNCQKKDKGTSNTGGGEILTYRGTRFGSFRGYLFGLEICDDNFEYQTENQMAYTRQTIDSFTPLPVLKQ